MNDFDLNTTDAQTWAKAFIYRFKGRLLQIDEADMIAWFANAIEQGRIAGYGAGHRDAQVQREAQL